MRERHRGVAGGERGRRLGAGEKWRVGCGRGEGRHRFG